ncbi:HNH endonuclease [Acidovorax sp. 62]|uniref:HNH endonuclease n=1 Tax=Acidovorax sp. 62 TaxID=2035203 RepID=UPI000C181641|nr:HNH endonuclease [Acidovorax sp. 62]PIF89756.1 HNH endonuclease [Acidovorax sp. 62]
MRYWWVNHKQTSKQELGGGYLWSPIREASGARSQFYDNMRIATPGDAVLSFSGGVIRHLGRVADFASPAPKPDSFGAVGDYWSASGWLLPVAWEELPAAISPKQIIEELAPLLPAKYSPIHPESGNGNQKAYLAEISAALFEKLTGQILAEAPQSVLQASTTKALASIDDSIATQVLQDPGLDATTKQQVVLARNGQGLFRSRVFGLEQSCRLTHVRTPALLIASHIKPWRSCSTAAERLDGANGLLLAPHVDRLFDKGFISFTEAGQVLVSPRLDPNDLTRLGLAEACATGCAPFSERHAPYLQFHREKVFLK